MSLSEHKQADNSQAMLEKSNQQCAFNGLQFNATQALNGALKHYLFSDKAQSIIQLQNRLQRKDENEKNKSKNEQFIKAQDCIIATNHQENKYHLTSSNTAKAKIGFRNLRNEGTIQQYERAIIKKDLQHYYFKRGRKQKVKNKINMNELQSSPYIISPHFKQKADYSAFQCFKLQKQSNKSLTRNKQPEPFIIIKKPKHERNKKQKNQVRENIKCGQKERTFNQEKLQELEQMIISISGVRQSQITYCGGYQFSFQIGNNTFWVKSEEIIKMNPSWLGEYYLQLL